MERSVLIVDNDRAICKELEEKLRRDFVSTHIAHTGKDALEMLNKKKIDVIILEARMLDIDWLEVLEHAKEKVPYCEAIVTTDHGSHELVIQALRGGAIDYLAKPIKYDELNAALARALERLTEKEQIIHRHSILVVDDNREVTQKLKQFLEKEGYDVFTAYDGTEALEIINSEKIDAIVADIRMPVIGGIEFLQKARKLYRDIEVIMITGCGDEKVAVEALRKGAINYLRKPISLDELSIAVQNAIESVMVRRNHLYRHRELNLNAEIISKVNKELERRIEERTRELSQTQAQLFQTSKLAILGEMSAGLAHELNQPLTSISLTVANMAKLMERGLLTEEESKEVIQDLGDNVRRMSKVITHIRTFARQDSLKFRQFDVNESIENGLSLLGEQLRLHQVEVIRHLAQDLPTISGEPYQIEQVIINLLSNARDALDEKDKWEREKLKGWTKELIVRSALEGDWICVEISDNGTGMYAEKKQKIFDPFYTTKEVGKATGLGMSISYGIIQSHKGTIDAKSEEGKGTTVSIKLPVRIDEE